MVDVIPPVWVSPAQRGAPKSTRCSKNLGADIETGAAPSASAIILVAPLGFDITTVAVVGAPGPARTIGIDMLVEEAATRRRVLATNPVTRVDIRDAAHALMARDGKAVSVVRDSGALSPSAWWPPSSTLPATSASSASAARATWRRRHPRTGLPARPPGHGRPLGPTNILEVLFNMQTVYGDPATAPAPGCAAVAPLD